MNRHPIYTEIKDLFGTVGIAIIIMIYIILVIDDVSAYDYELDLSYGECSNLTWYNKTDFLSYDGPLVSNYCCQPYSGSVQNLSLSMSCGESVSGVLAGINYSVQCTQPVQNGSQKCFYDGSLDPGEEKTFKNDYCDIEVECEEQEAPNCDDVIEELNTKTEVSIKLQDDTFYVQVDDWKKEVDITEYSNFTASWSKDASCHVYKENNGSCIQECGFEECQAFSLHPSWWTKSFDTYTTSLNNLGNQSVEGWSRLAECESAKGDLETQRDTCYTTRNDALNDLDDCNDSKTDLQDSNTVKKVLLIFSFMFNIMEGIGIVALLLMIWKVKRGNQ